MDLKPINPAEFVAAVQPLLEAQDPGALRSLLKSRWTCEQVRSLLLCKTFDVRKVAALALALIGGKSCIEDLAAQLKNSDPMVNQMAEHALWSIWFRLGSPEANHELCRGTRALDRGDYAQATEHLTKAIQLDSAFSEAYNQRAIVKYLQEYYEESLEDCREAIRRMPCHFGAWAGMGHCHAHLGRLDDALKCYSKALTINPALSGIQQAVTELRARVV
jgi:tetratricopeptide (TPR) repeat protein